MRCTVTGAPREEQMKKRDDESTAWYVGREIAHEAKRQIRGFPRELKDQLVGGESGYHRTWGEEFARQIFGSPKRRRRGR